MGTLMLLPWLIVVYLSAIEKPRLWKLILGGCIFALICMAGMPGNIIFIMVIWGGIIIAKVLDGSGVGGKDRIFLQLCSAFIIIILGLGLSAACWCSVLEGRQYTRLHDTLTPELIMLRADVNLPLIYLATLFAPDLFGNITGVNFVLPQSVYFPDANMSGGMAVTFLALLGLTLSLKTFPGDSDKSKRRCLAIAAAGLYIFAVLCALGGNSPFYRYLIAPLPFIGNFPSPIRYRAIQCFAAAVLLAMGLNRLLRDELSCLPFFLKRWACFYVTLVFLAVTAALFWPLSQSDISETTWEGYPGSRIEGYFSPMQPVGSYSPKTSRVRKIALMLDAESKGEIRYASNRSIFPGEGVLASSYEVPRRGWFEFEVDIPPNSFVWVYPKSGRGRIGYFSTEISAPCFIFRDKKWMSHISRNALCLYTGYHARRESLFSKFKRGDIPRAPILISVIYCILAAFVIIIGVYYLTPRRYGFVIGIIAVGELFIFGILGFYKSTYNPGVILSYQIPVVRPLEYPFLSRMVIQFPEVADNRMLRVASDQPYHDNFVQLNNRFALMGYQMHPLETRFKHAIETAYGQAMDWPIYDESAPLPGGTRFLSNFSVGYLLTTKSAGMGSFYAGVPLPGDPAFFVQVNPYALPRAFTMNNIICASEDEQLEQLISGDLHQAVYINHHDGVGLLSSSADSPAANSSFESLQKMNPIHGINLDNPNRIEITAEISVPSMLVLTEVWYPYWQAKVDDKPVRLYRVNYCQRGVWLEKGRHKIVMVFCPAAFKIGTSISLGTAGLILLSFFINLLIKSRREK
jgi:hypothetical protein